MSLPSLNPRDGEAPRRDLIAEALRVLHDENAVVELRAFRGAGILSGYFDDHAALAEAAAGLDERAWGVFVTLNTVNPALLARSANQLKERPRTTTSDGDIVRRRWLPIDVDPVRPPGVSSTDEEKWAAYGKARAVRDHLRGLGWPEPVIADSGNGFWLLYPVDLPNTRESKELIKSVLEVLAAAFDDDEAKIDAAVYNAARLMRLYGTRNLKGTDTPERPHRRSRILKIADEEAR